MAVDVLTTIPRLYSFLNIGKIRPLYNKKFQEMYPKTQTRYLAQQFEVYGGHESLKQLILLQKSVCVFSQLWPADVSNNGAVHGAKHAEEAAGYYHKIMNGKFVVALVTLQLYLAELDHLSKELQAVPAVDIN